MIREAIEKLEEMATPKVLSAHGKSYSTESLVELASPEPLASPLELHTLSGLVAYVKGNLDGSSPMAAVVDGPAMVRLCSPLVGEFRQREVYIKASPFLSEGFPYGRFVDVETFVTKLQACFVQDEVTAAILRVVGNVQSEAVQTVVDDGVTQRVAARCGIGKLENVEVPNPVSLRPFRTFQEVEQPNSRFVLRMKRDDGGLPLAALFEGDDNLWRLEAVNRIRDYLTLHLDGVLQVFA